LLLIIFITIILVFAVILLNVVDKLYMGYELITDACENITKMANVSGAEQHDLIGSLRPAFNLLDLTLSVVIIFLFAGLFIYSRRR